MGIQRVIIGEIMKKRSLSINERKLLISQKIWEPIPEEDRYELRKLATKADVRIKLTMI